VKAPQSLEQIFVKANDRMVRRCSSASFASALD
jgi:hypothetical protein